MNDITPKEAITVLENRISPHDECKADNEANQAIRLAIKAIAFKEEIIRMVNMGVYPEAIVEWVRESEAENE